MRIIKKILSTIFRVVISMALLAFLFNQVDKKSLLGIIKGVNIPLLLLAFGVFFLVYVLCLFRWVMLLKALKIHLPLRRVIISYSGGVFFSLFLPSTIGGDLMRSIDLSAHTKRPREVIATIFLDRLSGYVGLVIVAVFALSIGWNLVQVKSALFAVVVITVILTAILLLLFNKFIYSKVNNLLHVSGERPRSKGMAGNFEKIRKTLKDLHQELHYFKGHRKVMLYSVIISILIQLEGPVVFAITALSLGLKIKFIYFLIFLPIIGAITLLPISIGGLGLRDATTIYFLGKVGIVKDMAFAMSLLNFSFILVYGAIGGLIYVLTVRHRRLQRPQPLSL
ncbi:MAG: lysylphosphatidylglycerol synthase transmembrane domain-containing protein [Candidatus Omnitrophota bacterium]|nr:lysylphosphatidylglycerol synthase transmembrane domain-containing protein [Candidatus Omnitrophota bacterium]